MIVDVMTFVNWLLMLLAAIGWLHTLSKYVHPSFAPGLLCGIIGTAVFLSGIAGILDVQAAGLWIGSILFLISGLGMLICSVVHKESFRGFLSWTCLLMLLLAGWFLYTLHGMKLTGYDDFTHWGIIARILVREGRFPLPADRGLTFQAYPPGSAVMIFAFSRLTGLREEWAWLFAQALVTVSMFLPLTAFGKNQKQQAVLTVVLLILISKNTFFINLLVDTLVTGCALYSICFCMYEREHLEKKFLLLIPVMAFFITVKTSAVFYVVTVLLYAAFRIRKNRKTGACRERPLPSWLVPAAAGLVAFIPFLLWRQYVRDHFPAGMSSKHALSLEYFRATMGDKTWDGVKYILVQLLKSFFSPGWEALYLLIFGLALAVFLRRRSRGRDNDGKQAAPGGHEMLPDALAIIFASGAGYFLSLAVSYIVSMPWAEASVLAGFERYLHTYTAFACGILSIAMIAAMEEGKEKTLWLSIWLLLLLLTPQRRYDFYLPWQMQDEPRTAFDKLTENIEKPYDRNITLVFEKEPENWGYIADYFTYMAEYVLDAPSVRACTLKELQAGETEPERTDPKEDSDILLIPENTYDKLK